MRTNGIFVYDINDMTCHTRNMICHTSGMVLRTVQVIIFAYSGKTASEELAVFMFC